MRPTRFTRTVMPVIDPPSYDEHGNLAPATGGFPELDDDAAIPEDAPNPVHWVEGKNVTVQGVLVQKAWFDTPPRR